MAPDGVAVTGGVRTEVREQGAVLRVVLATPKANILDQEKIDALTGIFAGAAEAADLKAIVLDSEGDHFSFGASVPEHLPGRFERMIPAFGNLFRRMMETPVTTIAVVRGQCLGGGLELASMCTRVFAQPTARMGQPEIVLGVLAPVASVVLPERVGRRHAEELCVTGRVVDAAEAHRLGLADEVADDPAAAAEAWIARNLLPRSASSLRLALRAARTGWTARFLDGLAAAERLYLEELMDTADAREGLQAFLDRREPVWRNA